jgi:hypothetical protein
MKSRRRIQNGKTNVRIIYNWVSTMDKTTTLATVISSSHHDVLKKTAVKHLFKNLWLTVVYNNIFPVVHLLSATPCIMIVIIFTFCLFINTLPISSSSHRLQNHTPIRRICDSSFAHTLIFKYTSNRDYPSQSHSFLLLLSYNEVHSYCFCLPMKFRIIISKALCGMIWRNKGQ